MNTNSRNKKTAVAFLLSAVFILAPAFSANAQTDDEFGVWTTVEATAKISKRVKLDFEAEHRTVDNIGAVERISVGAGATCKITDWLKASAGYIFMYCREPDTKKLRWNEENNSFETSCDDEGNEFINYDTDHAYWTDCNRAHFSLTGEYKVGRVEFSLRERLQYTYTNSATTDETTYFWECVDPMKEKYVFTQETESDFKEAKHNVTLRSRLTAKWDIANCKITPFASVELYTRLDKWRGFDRLRYRLGATYKINKDNKVSLYYLFQHDNDDDKPRGHAIGLGYSIDL